MFIRSSLLPLPEQLSENVVSRVIGPTKAVPFAARVPDQPPDAEQLVAPLLVHVNVVDPFGGTDAGFAVSVTETGPRDVTATVTARVTVPPEPVQVSV